MAVIDLLAKAMADAGVLPADVERARAEFDAAVKANRPGEARRIAQSPVFKWVPVQAIADKAKDWAGLTHEQLVLRYAADIEMAAVANAIQAAAIRSLSAKLADLEKRLDEGPFKFMGPYTEGMTFGKGNFVSHQGSLWIANHETRERPGTGYGWTLCAKRGADGKDLRA